MRRDFLHTSKSKSCFPVSPMFVLTFVYAESKVQLRIIAITDSELPHETIHRVQGCYHICTFQHLAQAFPRHWRTDAYLLWQSIIMISLITFTTAPRANQAITTVAGIATEGEIKLQNSDRKTETHTTIPRSSTNSLWNIKAPQRTQGVCIFKTHRYQKTETNIPTSEKGIFVKFSTAYMKLKLNLLFLLP